MKRAYHSVTPPPLMEPTQQFEPQEKPNGRHFKRHFHRPASIDPVVAHEIKQFNMDDQNSNFISNDEEDDLDYRFEFSPVIIHKNEDSFTLDDDDEDYATAVQNSEEKRNDDEFNYDKDDDNFVFEKNEEEYKTEEEKKAELNRLSSQLNVQLKEKQQQITRHNQIKLYADITYQHSQIKFLKDMVAKELGLVNDCTKNIKKLNRPDEYSQKAHQMHKYEVETRTHIFEQIEAMCSILSQCPDENFKEKASSILANKSDELQKVQEEREALESEIHTLEEQFMAQNDFITNQLFKRDKTKAKMELKTIYTNALNNPKQLAYNDKDALYLNNLAPLQKGNHGQAAPFNAFGRQNRALLKPKINSIISPLDSRGIKSESNTRDPSKRNMRIIHRTVSCDNDARYNYDFDSYDDF